MLFLENFGKTRSKVMSDVHSLTAPSLERSCSPLKWQIAKDTLLEYPTKSSVIVDIHSSGWIHMLVKEPNHLTPRRRSFSIPKELATALIDDTSSVICN